MLARTRLLRQQASGTAVGFCTLGVGELGIDTASNDRMDERQRAAGLDDPGRRQQVGRVGRLGLVETRKSRRLEKVALFEHRQRPGEPPGMLRQPAEPKVDRAADRSGTDSLDVARRLRSRRDPSFAHCLDEFTQQERRPGGCPQAGVDENRIRSPGEPRFHQLGNCCSRQRRGTDHIGGGIGRHRCE